MPGAVAKQKESKNQRRRAQKKAKKVETTTEPVQVKTPEETLKVPEATPSEPPNDEDTEDEYDAGPAPVLDLDPDDPLYEQFKGIFGHFQQLEEESAAAKEPDKPDIYYSDDDNIQDEDEENETKTRLSKKARKAQNQLSVAELKALVKKPDVVEWYDVNAPDPRLLASLKAARNVVPVPSHWQLKREYLSSKRGVEKAQFALPKFIQDTGIAEMRDAVLEKQAEATLKQKQRERVQGKLGKLDIDYQKLYEAFFRHQTKPELTRFGEVYYEGKENETNLKHLRPGELSEELREALSMPPGAPPPWLINQQRFGPPPSYPALRIPGLNAPPPPGGQWGFHPGGYGKPPVDEFNKPLFGGDIFGNADAPQNRPTGEPVERNIWGELLPPEEESEEEEDESDDEDAGSDADSDAGDLPPDRAGPHHDPSGLETPSGFASAMPSEYGGVDLAEGEFTLRKHKRGTETEEPAASGHSAGRVLKEHNIRAQGFFGGERAYDISSASAPVLDRDDGSSGGGRKRKAGDVDVSLDADALAREGKLSKEELARRFEQGRREEQEARGWGAIDQDELSKMIADESRKRARKDEDRKGRR